MTRLSDLQERWRTRLVMMAALEGHKLHVPLRYMEFTGHSPVVYWQAGNTTKGYINMTPHAGLRFIGKVLPESYGGHRSFDSGDWTGWYTNPDGYYSNDGDGLVWGVVYQVPAKKRWIRCVAGWQLGGYDEGPTIDFSRIFTGPSDYQDVKGSEPARDAARYADDMAREIGEEEREHERKYREENDDEAS